MAAEYDVFLSHAWADGERPQHICDALTKAGLRVWFDAREISDFSSITRAVTEGLAKSKALLAYYSKTYPLRRACQWELTAAFLAAEREGDPRRRVLVINPEQSADHIHPVHLRDEKFRRAPADNRQMRELVQSIVKHVAALDGLLADIHPLTPSNWYGRMPVGSTRFVGRLAEMWQVHSLLNAADAAQITGAVVNVGQVRGLGGVGKSLLAEEYGLHFGAAYPGGIFWLRAYGNDDSKTALGPLERDRLRADQIRAMAERLDIDTQGMTEARIDGVLKRAIGDRGEPCLWVVDDVPDGLNGEALRGWFAPHSLARTLITTRSREYGSLAQGIDLSVLPPQEAYQLLTSRRQPIGDAEQEQARTLSENLGYHALALDLTASAVSSFGGATPFASFRAQLARKDRDALELATDLADALPTEHKASIAQTMLSSIRNLGAEGQDFLRLASMLAVAPIPASLVCPVFAINDSLSHTDAEWRQAQAFDQVEKASLAEVAGEKRDARSVHTLVSRAVRFHEKGAPARSEALRAAAVVALKVQLMMAAPDRSLHELIDFQVAHARQLVTIPATLDEAYLVEGIARYDLERGAVASARILYEHALEFFLNTHGPEHSNTLSSMCNLADVLRTQGELVDSCNLQQETLVICRRVLGPEHPQTLLSMHNLAATLSTQGALAEARKLYEETLAIHRRVLGPEHPNTLQTVNNLAETLRNQNDLATARQLHEDVLDIRRRVLGLEHPHTLHSLNNLALTLKAQGDLVGARELQQEVVEITRHLLGAEHPVTSGSAWNLFLTLNHLGEPGPAWVVLDRNLRWLLYRDPSTLGADQRRIRGYVAQVVTATGAIERPAQSATQRQKIGRNDPCLCGSGKKYKRCCGA